MDIHFMNYPHGMNFWDFEREIWILLHALDINLTYANNCLGQNSKNVLILSLRINISPDAMDTTDGSLI